jgi:hypothetical protein
MQIGLTPWIQIRIRTEIKSWIGIRIETNADPNSTTLLCFLLIIAFLVGLPRKCAPDPVIPKVMTAL